MSDASSSPPAHVFVEHVIWTPGAEWIAALEHLAGRFARVEPLDVASVVATGPLHSQIQQLSDWATRAGADLNRELGRWFDEHLAMHLRPDPGITRAIRALATHAPVIALSTLPPRPAESIARHLGAWRSFTALHGNIGSAEQLAERRELDGARELFAAGDTPRPPEIAASSFAAHSQP